MPQHIALLRGINVGGHHKLPMKDLRRLFEAAGARSVRTYIQSGNVVFEAPTARAQGITEEVQARIQEELGFEAPIVHRTEAELARVQDSWPFDIEGLDPKLLHVGFLADKPRPAKVAALDPDRSPPDVFVVKDKQVYLHFPNGSARSRLSNAWFDAQLGTLSTMRNWRTVQQLLQMCGEPGPAGENRRPAR